MPSSRAIFAIAFPLVSREEHRFALQLLRRALLNFFHDPCPSAVRIYSYLLLLHETEVISGLGEFVGYHWSRKFPEGHNG
jgi:hypothetical protein